MRSYIVKVNVLVPPLEVMDDALISQFLLDDKNVLEKVNDSFFDIEMVELGDHGLLIFQVSLILINERISLVNDISNIVEHGAIGAHVHLLKFVC